MKRVIYFLILCVVTACSSPTSAPPTYTFQASASPTEGGTITPPNGSFPEGQQVTVLATPSTGWRFIRWEGDLSSTQSSASLTMTKNMSVVGVFEKRDYPLNIVIEGNGSVEEEVVVARNYQFQTVVKLTAVPDEGWEFTGWSGDATGDENPTEITITDETNIIVHFERIPAKIVFDPIGQITARSVTVKGRIENPALLDISSAEICVDTSQDFTDPVQCIELTSYDDDFELRIKELEVATPYFIQGNVESGDIKYSSATLNFTTLDSPTVEDKIDDFEETSKDLLPTSILTAALQNLDSIDDDVKEEYVDSLNATYNELSAEVEKYYSAEEFKEAVEKVLSVSVTNRIPMKPQLLSACENPYWLAYGRGVTIDLSATTVLAAGVGVGLGNRGGGGAEIIYDFVNLDRSLYTFQMCGIGVVTAGAGVGFSGTLNLSGFHRIFTNVKLDTQNKKNRFAGTSRSVGYSFRTGIAAKVGLEAGIGFSVGQEVSHDVPGNGIRNWMQCPVDIITKPINRGVTDYSLEGSFGGGLGATLHAVNQLETTITYRQGWDSFYKSYKHIDRDRFNASGRMALSILNPSPINGISSGSILPGPTELILSAMAVLYGSFDPAECPTSVYLPQVETLNTSNITNTTASISGSVNDDGGANVTDRGICFSTSQYPTLSNTCVKQGSGTGNFIGDVTGLEPEVQYYARAYATNSVGTSYGDQVEFTTSSSSGSTDGRDNTTAVVDVTNPATGRTWMDRNLGASRAATSPTDAQAYGDLYQWGRGADGHQKRNSTTTTTLSSTDQPGHGSFILASTNSPWDWRSPQNNDLWQGVNGINNPCPVGYRIPTITEWNDEILSWSSNNSAGAYASPLKLPMAGIRFPDGLFSTVGSSGGYWSSSLSGIALSLYFNSSFTNVSSNDRANGYSIRCIKDSSQSGRDNTTEVVEVTNPITGRVWMDRNLGASRAATSSTDSQAYGDLYQWGRGADGHEKRNSPTTRTLSSTDQPGHDSFILVRNSPYDWRNPQNNNLWQGVNGINNPCPAGYRIPTAAEWNAERQSWNSISSTGAYASLLKLPMAGHLFSNGTFYVVGSNGYYWSSSVYGSFAQYLNIYSTNAVLNTYNRAVGLSVRCIKD